MSRKRLLLLSLGGTITMVPSAEGGIAPKLGAAELVASVPDLATVAEIEADSPARLPSPSLTPHSRVPRCFTVSSVPASAAVPQTAPRVSAAAKAPRRRRFVTVSNMSSFLPEAELAGDLGAAIRGWPGVG